MESKIIEPAGCGDSIPEKVVKLEIRGRTGDECRWLAALHYLLNEGARFEVGQALESMAHAVGFYAGRPNPPFMLKTLMDAWGKIHVDLIEKGDPAIPPPMNPACRKKLDELQDWFRRPSQTGGPE